MIRVIRQHAFILMCGLVLCLSQRGAAEEAVKPIIELTPQTDLNSLQANKTALSLQTDNGVTSLKIVGTAKAAFPGIHYAPASPLSLTGAKGIEAEVTNLSGEAISVSLRVENDTDGKAAHWSIGSLQLGPGDTRTLQSPFGMTYGKPGYALDPAKIVGITFYISGSSDQERSILLRNVLPFTQIKPQQPADIGKPPTDGLVLWLDPSKADTVTANADRRISVLVDRSGKHHDAKPASVDSAPLINPLELAGRPMMRFDSKSALKIDAIRPSPGGVTVFVVYSKVKGKQQSLAGGNLFVSRPQVSTAPGVAPNFCIPAPDAKAAWKLGQTVALENVPIGSITIGEGFCGDIAEVLVYDHIFASEGERRKVTEYIYSKWNVAFNEPGWVREGPLDPKPTRTRDDLPLSDQGNAGRWKLDTKFTDEFDTTQIDLKRYELFYTGGDQWVGRAPGLFRPENTFLKDGSLHIKLDKATPDQMKGRSGYRYTTGYIRTLERTGYGYYEIEAKPGKSAIDNAFWFTDTGDPNNGLEIDVFELGPTAKEYHNRVIMTAHVWGEKGDKRHWGSLVAYTAPWELGDDYHVWGLEWTKEELIWYIDGSVVRKLKNTNWHLPMKMIFDCEPMIDWFGPVDDKDLPTEFNVKYLRVWRQPNQ